VPAARGLIYDRNGRLWWKTRRAVDADAGRPADRGVAAVYRSISNVIGMPVEEIEAKVEDGADKQGEFTPTVIKTDLDRDTALVLMELEPHTPGMHVEVDPARHYLSGDLLSQILGYVGPLSAEEYAVLQDHGYRYQDYIGKTGVESEYEDALRGTDGKKLIEWTRWGALSVISEEAGGRHERGAEHRPGLQREMTEVLQQYAVNSLNAAAVMMDVHTGEVLGMVSLPTFDNNVFSSNLSQEQLTALIEAPGKPLVNHAIAERYPPGSTFKTIVGSGALQEGVAYPGTTITSRGYITIENEFDPNVVYVYPDWAPLGTLDFYSGLAMSSNVYFLPVGRVRRRRVPAWARAGGAVRARLRPRCADGDRPAGRVRGAGARRGMEGSDAQRAVGAGRHVQLRDRAGVRGGDSAADADRGELDCERRAVAAAARGEGVRGQPGKRDAADRTTAGERP
jgi:penicillin-binding protein 2